MNRIDTVEAMVEYTETILDQHGDTNSFMRM
jgi:hypothetical protein